MKPTWITFAALAGVFLLTTPGAGAGCPDLKDADRAKLIDYVHKKYKVPATTRLELTEVALVESTCYRKLQFRSQGSGRPFELKLYLAPDLRFLTLELLDLRVDPLEEERQKKQALLAGLTRGNFPALGPETAPVTLTVFSDFQCPYCSRLAKMLNDEILPAEGDRVRLVFRHFPLSMHSWARPAAEAAVCAQEQGNTNFWSLHNFIFEHQQEMTTANLRQKALEHLKSLRDFDQGKFEGCLVDRKTAARIEQDLAFGKQGGVSGTPTLFINGERIGSVAAPEQLRTLIRQYSRPGQKAGASGN